MYNQIKSDYSRTFKLFTEFSAFDVIVWLITSDLINHSHLFIHSEFVNERRLFLFLLIQQFSEIGIRNAYLTRDDLIKAIVQNFHTFGGCLVIRIVLYLQASFKR